MTEIKLANFDEINVGDSEFVTKTVTQADVTLFAGITGDFNPLHVNEEFAKKSMFKKRLVHGAFSSGLISTVLGMKLPGPGALYLNQTCKFLKPVFINDTLTAIATVKEKVVKRELIIWVIQERYVGNIVLQNIHGRKIG